MATTTASSSSDSDQGSSDGPSAGAKAGIAFGVLGGVLLIGLLIFFLFNRRRKQRQEDDEKPSIIGMGATSGGPLPPTPAMTSNENVRAPRVSLRPVTQFFPNLNVDKRSSKGAAMALTPTATSVARGNYERPSTSQSNHAANPFGNNAERAPSPNHERTESRNPFSSPADAAAGAVAAVPGGIVRKTSLRVDEERNPRASPGSQYARPASPAGSMMSMSSNAPAGGLPNVHRVQLDFKPTLEDEMELKAGDLVRLLHEYDDGWALCVRMDRSQQGVVPRTCLSTRPVKPRPPPGGGRQGPPVNLNGPPRGHPRNPSIASMTPGQRPMRPQSPGGRSTGGPGSRAQSPAGRSMSPYGGPRSQSPGPRSQSPGPLRAPLRSQSPALMNRSSPMNPSSGPSRPIPGQAI